MKTILRNYGIRMTLEERQTARAQAGDMVRTRGTNKTPLPPRSIQVQSGPRGLLVTWYLPDGPFDDIQRWRVYKDTEDSLYAEINDRGTRQCFIETSSGSTPPTINVFVSSLNALGVESQKIQAQGKSTAEAGAPAMPAPPPEYVDTSGGGGDKSSDYTRDIA